MFEIYYIRKYFFSKYCFQRTRRRRTYMKWVSWASCGINWSKKWYFDDWCLIWLMLSKSFYWMYENVHHILAIWRNSWCRIIVLLLHVFPGECWWWFRRKARFSVDMKWILIRIRPSWIWYTHSYTMPAFQTQTYREQLSNWMVFVFFYFSDEFEDGLDEMGKIGGAMISPN